VVAVEPASPDVLAAIGDGLKGYNRAAGHNLDRTEFCVTHRGPDGTVLGGAKCSAGSGMMYIEWLWLDATLRGSGIGRAMLACAEDEGRRRGCSAVHLDTFSFQAPKFYEAAGYRVFGTLDYPATGSIRYYLVKPLEAPTDLTA
jgi:GNAT superfamily N-acetyltransferase